MMRKFTLMAIGLAGLGVAGCGATSEQYAADRKEFCVQKGLSAGTQEFRECIARRLHFQHQVGAGAPVQYRSEEHTSELQSLMRISYAVLCLQKKKKL